MFSQEAVHGQLFVYKVTMRVEQLHNGVPNQVENPCGREVNMNRLDVLLWTSAETLTCFEDNDSTVWNNSVKI